MSKDIHKYKEGDLLKIKPTVFVFIKEFNEDQFDAGQLDEHGEIIDTWTLNYKDTKPYKPRKVKQ
jgi:hypothetical protein